MVNIFILSWSLFLYVLLYVQGSDAEKLWFNGGPETYK